MGLGGGGKQKQLEQQVASLQKEVEGKDKELAEKRDQLDNELARVVQGDRLRAELEERQAQAEERCRQAEQRCQALEAEGAKQRSELEAENEQALAAERGAFQEELADAGRRLEEDQEALAAARGAVVELEGRLSEASAELQEQQQVAEEQQRAAEALRRQAEEESQQPQRFLDLAVGECEFASAFAYTISVQVKGRGEKRSTDVSAPSQRPVFKNPSFLLPVDGFTPEDVLVVSAHVNLADPTAVTASPIPRLLGEGHVRLEGLDVQEGSNASRRLVRSVSFMRSGAGAAGQAEAATDQPAKLLHVGRATIVLQVKVMAPAEAADSQPQAAAPLPPLCPSLDKQLWPARPFHSLVRALVHRVEALPAAIRGLETPAARSTVRVSLRLHRADGQVLQESSSSDMPLPAAEQGSEVADVAFGQELAVPLSAAEPGELTLQLAVEVVSAEGPGGGASLAVPLALRWPPEALPALAPLHLCARPTPAASPSLPSMRSQPVLLASLVREPEHDALAAGSGGSQCAFEVRVQGVPATRPLPEPAEGAMLAICPDPGGGPMDSSALEVPSATYFYDQRLDLGAFIRAHFSSSLGKQPSYFLTPAVASSCSPQWEHFVVRCAAPAQALADVSVLLFSSTGGRSSTERPFGGRLLGFATLDASSLSPQPQKASEPLQRSFLLDLRLLEAPGASASLELEARVWPHGGAAKGLQPEAPVQPAARSGGGAGGGGPAGSLQQEANEFRLNHELSVQLAKEFNLRAAALKRAGEEIVSLRKQVELLSSENVRLKAQLEEEEAVAEEARGQPVPEGLDQLSSAELASKLQRALERYRAEKAKAAELGRRLEVALKEASRRGGLERSLEELEGVHLEQNRELQRLQEELRRAEAYRQTARAQEKVIAKLERVLEGSLQEVQKAQKVRSDVERIKGENARLRERCAHLVGRRRSEAAEVEDSQGLQQQLRQREQEVHRLEALVRELRGEAGERWAVAPPRSPPPMLAKERRRLAELEEEKQEWEQRSRAAQQRLQMLQLQLTETSRRYGGELSQLEVELAKRDARIAELEFLLKERGRGASGLV